MRTAVNNVMKDKGGLTQHHTIAQEVGCIVFTNGKPGFKTLAQFCSENFAGQPALQFFEMKTISSDLNIIEGKS